ncbi:MAG: hypothetical protein PUC73_08215 [Lachnospiraceae bacterium]|nr:hypothetical protein [Lachnospiraceae bacterium]
MLKLKYLFENFELARKCLELYEYDKESIDEMLSYYLKRLATGLGSMMHRNRLRQNLRPCE